MIERLIRFLLRSGPLGWCLLALLVLGALSPLLLLLTRRKLEGRGGLVLWVYSALGLVLMGMSAGSAQLARQASLHDLIQPGPVAVRAIAEGVDWSSRTQWGVGLFVLLAVPLVVSVIGIRRLRATQPSAAEGSGFMAVLATCLAIAWFAALGLFAHAAWVQEVAGGCWEPACRYEAWTESFRILTWARTGVLAAAVAASVVVPAVIWLRPLRVQSLPRRSAALVVLSCGVWAYCLVRPMAWDAQSPLPFSADPPLPAPVDLPLARRCEAVEDFPTVIEADWGLTVDGRTARDAEELGPVLASKRKVWTQLNPRAPFPGVAYLLLNPDYPAWEAGKLVRAARKEGYRDVRAGVAVPRRAVQTHTAGQVEYSPRWCSIRLRQRVDWAALVSWGEAVELDERP